MSAIADSSYVVALLNRRDPHHEAAARVAASLRSAPWLPAPALTEITYLLSSRLGAGAAQRFVAEMATTRVQLGLLHPTAADLGRAAEVMLRYEDLRLSFVDALIVALSERLAIRSVLTLDRRHFLTIRPAHCAAFELLPAD
jgi:predicted nucleic acid-binding protein